MAANQSLEFFLGVRLIDWIGLVSWLGDAAGGRWRHVYPAYEAEAAASARRHAVLLVFHDSDACQLRPHLNGLGINLQHRRNLVRDSEFGNNNNVLMFEFDFSWRDVPEADDGMCILLKLQKLPPRG